MKYLHPCLISACEYGWWDYDVTSCNHQCADKHGNCGVLKGVESVWVRYLDTIIGCEYCWYGTGLDGDCDNIMHVCGWQDVGMVICGSVVSFLYLVWLLFCDSIPTCSFIFFKTCSCSFLVGEAPCEHVHKCGCVGCA